VQGGGPALVVQVLPRKNSLPYCSGCLRRGRPYDHLKERRFEFVPLLVFLTYRMRRVDCHRCGVTVEIAPWSDGKNQLKTTYRWFLAGWTRRLSWGEVGAIFRTSWDSVCRAVEHAVEWGLAHRDLSQVTAVGIDEVAWQRGPTCMTLLYDIGAGTMRLLAVAEHRTEASLRSCLDGLGQEFCPRVEFVRSDMWQP
jgi:transposase